MRKCAWLVESRIELLKKDLRKVFGKKKHGIVLQKGGQNVLCETMQDFAIHAHLHVVMEFSKVIHICD